MKSIKFSEQIDIGESQEKLFDYTQDYNNRLQWDTFLTEARLLDAIKADKGVKAWCVAKNGMGMETEYVSFNRPKVAAVKMTKGPFMFKDFAASWNFSETNGTTTVTFLYSLKLRFPYSLVGFYIKNILIKEVKQRLVDLKNQFGSHN